MRNYPSVALQIPRVYLPGPEADLKRWAVVACDQYTSQPEYWKKVEEFVGDCPSTLHLIFPEIYLEDQGKERRVAGIQEKMKQYLEKGILECHETAVYIERTMEDKVRRGVVVALDLEHYDHSKGAETLVRATEGTILDRLPPRIAIREGAELEFPHIMVLIDDPADEVIGGLQKEKQNLPPLYDFPLMMESGHLSGYRIDAEREKTFIASLEKLTDREVFTNKYGVDDDRQVLLYAMGDGNHSLATAKEIWEKVKKEKGMEHPCRYALIELVNVHDPALEFEPIHRVLFELDQDILSAMSDYYQDRYSYQSCSREEMIDRCDKAGDRHIIGVISEKAFGSIEIARPDSNLPVGSLQVFLDKFIQENGCKIDYVHGTDVVVDLGKKPGNIGFYLPAMNKSDLFKTVILDGALPRKTFSMGEAHQKRFYMEARKIL